MTDAIRSALEAAREALRLLLATPEIADAHPADKDEETHVAERKARASISQIDAALASLDAPQGEGRFARLSPDAPAQIPEGYSAPLDMRTTRQLIAERERSAPAPAPDALREAGVKKIFHLHIETRPSRFVTQKKHAPQECLEQFGL